MLKSMRALTILTLMSGTAEPPHSAREFGAKEYPPVLIRPDGGLPEIYADSAAIIRSRVVLQFVVDTSGRVRSGTVRVLYATDSVVARAVRSITPTLRYMPARLVDVDGRCVRFNDGEPVCGGHRPHVHLIAGTVEFSVQYE